MFGHVTQIENLDNEISRLRKQLNKILDAIGLDGVDVPCPSNVGLNDTSVNGFCINCRDCWQKALNEIKEEEVE